MGLFDFIKKKKDKDGPSSCVDCGQRAHKGMSMGVCSGCGVGVCAGCGRDAPGGKGGRLCRLCFRSDAQGYTYGGPIEMPPDPNGDPDDPPSAAASEPSAAAASEQRTSAESEFVTVEDPYAVSPTLHDNAAGADDLVPPPIPTAAARDAQQQQHYHHNQQAYGQQGQAMPFQQPQHHHYQQSHSAAYPPPPPQQPMRQALDTDAGRAVPLSPSRAAGGGAAAKSGVAAHTECAVCCATISPLASQASAPSCGAEGFCHRCCRAVCFLCSLDSAANYFIQKVAPQGQSPSSSPQDSAAAPPVVAQLLCRLCRPKVPITDGAAFAPFSSLQPAASTASPVMVRAIRGADGGDGPMWLEDATRVLGDAADPEAVFDEAQRRLSDLTSYCAAAAANKALVGSYACGGEGHGASAGELLLALHAFANSKGGHHSAAARQGSYAEEAAFLLPLSAPSTVGNKLNAVAAPQPQPLAEVLRATAGGSLAEPKALCIGLQTAAALLFLHRGGSASAAVTAAREAEAAAGGIVRPRAIVYGGLSPLTLRLAGPDGVSLSPAGLLLSEDFTVNDGGSAGGLGRGGATTAALCPPQQVAAARAAIAENHRRMMAAGASNDFYTAAAGVTNDEATLFAMQSREPYRFPAEPPIDFGQRPAGGGHSPTLIRPFVAPEVVAGRRGAGGLSPASDVYSLGACLFAAVAGDAGLSSSSLSPSSVEERLASAGATPYFINLVKRMVAADMLARPPMGQCRAEMRLLQSMWQLATVD